MHFLQNIWATQQEFLRASFLATIRIPAESRPLTLISKMSYKLTYFNGKGMTLPTLRDLREAAADAFVV